MKPLHEKLQEYLAGRRTIIESSLAVEFLASKKQTALTEITALEDWLRNAIRSPDLKGD